MRFSIITPTYKRANKLARAVASVQAQTYTDWELIIVNDSPTDTSYQLFERTITDPKIRYLKNTKNEGVNYSRNHALDERSIHSTWTIFLDDDDYLAPDALQTFIDLMYLHPEKKWFVTNRAYTDGTPTTSFPNDDTDYTYVWDYLILHRGRGDATHCIESSYISTIRFSRHIRQAEEWLFFYQLGLTTPLFYHNHNSTITDGYEEGGLNIRKRSTKSQLHTLSLITREGSRLKLLSHPTFLVYLAIRLLRAFVK